MDVVKAARLKKKLTSKLLEKENAPHKSEILHFKNRAERLV